MVLLSYCLLSAGVITAVGPRPTSEKGAICEASLLWSTIADYYVIVQVYIDSDNCVYNYGMHFQYNYIFTYERRYNVKLYNRGICHNT